VGTITKCAWHDIGDAFERVGNDARSPKISFACSGGKAQFSCAAVGQHGLTGRWA
jgi:hypothetical protein